MPKGLAFGRNPLVFPAGRPAGVDRGHIALTGNPAFISLIANPTGAATTGIGFTRLGATIATGTVNGTSGFTGGVNYAGPYCGFAAGASVTNDITYPTPKSGTPTGILYACIITPITAPTSSVENPLMGTSSASAFQGDGIEVRTTSITLELTGGGSGGTDSSTINLTLNTPYFIVASVGAAAINYGVLNLKTGQYRSHTVTAAYTFHSQGASWAFGGGASSSFGSGSGCQWAAALLAINGSLLSPAAIQMWAADPWSFWYPDRSFAVSPFFMSQAPQGAATIDVPPHWRGITLPPQWTPLGQLLRNTAQDTSSSAVETNPHWQGKTYPPQWLADRKLLINHRAVVESSSAVETNPHTTFKTLPPQWVRNPILLLNTAQDFSSSAVETNPHWKGIQWPPQWAINKPLFRVTAQDFSASAVETNVHTIFKTWPPQWQPLAKLRQNDPQDFSSSAVETNPHWQGKTWAAQWSLALKQSLDPNPSTQVQPETNVHFIPRTYPSQWAPLKNLQNTAQDFSSSAVETNVHTTFKTWPLQWTQTINLLLNTDTLAPTFQPETNVHFIPRTWAPQWVLLLRTQNTAQDFSSSAVETNPHWIGRPWPTQWAPAISLRTTPAIDVPAITFDTPPHTVFRTWLPQWMINLPLLRGTAQDFSSTAVETNVHFIPHTWPPQWNLQASLKQGTAQDFSTTPPAFVEIYENQFFSAFARIGAIGRNP